MSNTIQVIVQKQPLVVVKTELKNEDLANHPCFIGKNASQFEIKEISQEEYANANFLDYEENEIENNG